MKNNLTPQGSPQRTPTTPRLTPAGVRRLLTFIPAKAEVVFGGSDILPTVTLKVDYHYFTGLFERIYQLHKARCFKDTRVDVTLHDGRSFQWNAMLAHQCFSRRRPNYNKLISMLPA